MRWYPVINRTIQDTGIPIHHDRPHTELGREILKALLPTTPFTVDCDYAALEWNTLQAKEPE